MRRVLLLTVAALVVAGFAGGERRAEAKGGPATKAVHRAIRAGADWLKARHANGFESGKKHSTPEIVLYTLSHAGVKRDDPVFVAALLEVTTNELSYTYRVATMAMALSRINPYKYRARIAHCAQWMVDSQ